MLLWCNTFVKLQLPSLHLSLNTALFGCLTLLPDEECLFLGLFLLGSMDNEVRFRHSLESQFSSLILPVESDACEVVWIIFHHKLLIGVLPSPFNVRHSWFTHHLVGSFLALDGYLDSAGCEGAHAVALNPEHFHHVIRCHRWCLRIHALFIHVDSSLTRGRMCHFVPFLSELYIQSFQFLERWKVCPVCLDELQVRMADVLLGGNVLSGEVPFLVKYLALQSVEEVLNRFAGSIEWGCRTMGEADFTEELLVLQFLVSTLVIIYDFVGLVSAHLDGHSVTQILGFIVLAVADAETKEAFRVSVYYLIYAGGSYLAVLILVVEVQLRTVTIPECIPHLRKFRLVSAVKQLV